MFHVKVDRLARKVAHPVQVKNPPQGKSVQVFVHSHRTGLFYPQAPGNALAALGNESFYVGLYDVVAVALDGPAKWEPVSALPAGAATPMHRVLRIGL